MTPSGWILTALAIVAVCAWLLPRWIGFRAQTPGCYAATEPYFDIRKILAGDMRCDGVIYGPLGRVVSRFNADFRIEWDENRGRMIEHFRYDSGNTQDREWWLEVSDDGTLRADAEDLLDTGHGRISGATLQMNYRIRLPKEAGGHVLDVTDWMYLTPDGIIVNRSQFRKFGVKVAELVATIRQVDAS